MAAPALAAADSQQGEPRAGAAPPASPGAPGAPDSAASHQHTPDAPSSEATAKWRIYTDTAQRLRRTGKPAEEVEAYLVQALVLAREGFGARDPHVAGAANNLAELYRVSRRYDEAEKLYLEALPILKDAFGRLDARVATLLHNLANVYWQRGSEACARPGGEGPGNEDLGRAAELLTEALSVRSTLLGRHHPETTASLFHLASVKWAQGAREDALRLARECVAVMDEDGQGDSPLGARRVSRLAAMLLEAGRAEEALPLARRALAGAQRQVAAARGSAKGCPPGLALVLAQHEERVAAVLTAAGGTRGLQEAVVVLQGAAQRLQGLPESPLRDALATGVARKLEAARVQLEEVAAAARQ